MWSDTLQQLYDHGHPPERVDGYTLDQVHAFSGAIDRARKRDQTALGILLRAAQHYESKDFEKLITGSPQK